jgi:hypothetical protein
MLVHERVVIPRAAPRCVIFDSATHATCFPARFGRSCLDSLSEDTVSSTWPPS